MLDFLRHRLAENGEYQILLEREDDGTFVATSPALPGFVAYGPSEASAVRKLRKAIQRNLEGFAEDDRLVEARAAQQTSRHRAGLHFRLPLTGAAKLVLSAAAVAGTLALLKLSFEMRRRD